MFPITSYTPEKVDQKPSVAIDPSSGASILGTNLHGFPCKHEVLKHSNSRRNQHLDTMVSAALGGF